MTIRKSPHYNQTSVGLAMAYDAPPPDEQPLSNADYRAMQAALTYLNRARRKMDRAKTAGVDCTERDGQCDYLQDRLDKLKTVYFPHKP